MKTSLSLMLVCGAAALSGLAFSQNPPQPNPPQQNPIDHKIALLEQDLLSNRQKMEEISGELADTKAMLDATLKYLAGQAQSARDMAATLDDSETKGFTFGINPDSRHVLLKGWRDQLASAQKDVPAPKAPKKKDEAPKVSEKR